MKQRYVPKSGSCQGLVHGNVRYAPKVRIMPRSGTCQGQVCAKVRFTPRVGTGEVSNIPRSETRQSQVHAKVNYTLLNLKSLVGGVPKLCFAKDFWLDARLKVVLPSIAVEGVIC